MKKSIYLFVLVAVLFATSCEDMSVLPGDDITDIDSKWFTGTDVPSSSLGQNGDLYLDTVSGHVWLKKDNIWTYITEVTGPAGEDGQPGTTGPAGVSIEYVDVTIPASECNWDEAYNGYFVRLLSPFIEPAGYWYDFGYVQNDGSVTPLSGYQGTDGKTYWNFFIYSGLATTWTSWDVTGKQIRIYRAPATPHT
jgi:hypothetical protein